MIFSSNYIPSSLFFIPLLSLLFATSHSLQCSDKFFQLAKSRISIDKCQRLNTLGAELAWTTPAPRDNRNLVRVLFGAVLDDEMGWLAWGVNPGGVPQMVGTRAAIGIKDSNGTLFCKSYNVTLGTKIGCGLPPTELEEVNCTTFEYDQTTTYHILSVTLNLSSVDYNISRLNIVWQMGDNVDGDEPKMHGVTLQHVDSIETLDLNIGKCTSSIGELRVHIRQWHGILNIIGWGTLLPLGVIIARYFRKFPFRCKKIWFYFHVGCQLMGYGLGVVGWAMGLWLGHASKHYVFLTHRALAMVIFSLTTLQVVALRLRPGSGDGFRKLWDIYHHFLGYALLALIVANIFRGIGILRPANKDWKWAFLGILIGLASVTLALEFHTWKTFFRQRQKSKEPPSQPVFFEEQQEDSTF